MMQGQRREESGVKLTEDVGRSRHPSDGFCVIDAYGGHVDVGIAGGELIEHLDQDVW